MNLQVKEVIIIWTVMSKQEKATIGAYIGFKWTKDIKVDEIAATIHFGLEDTEQRKGSYLQLDLADGRCFTRDMETIAAAHNVADCLINSQTPITSDDLITMGFAQF